jgi:hypothetical protein|tara:strand:- start:138 stop:353 length:216 start_codon:yes stop_codon:yes gene_type:complete
LQTKWKELKIKLQLTKALTTASKKKRKESLKQPIKEWLRSTPKKQHKLVKLQEILKKLKLPAENLKKLQKK